MVKTATFPKYPQSIYEYICEARFIIVSSAKKTSKNKNPKYITFKSSGV